MNKSALMAAVCFSLGLFALGGCGDTSAGETLDVVAEPSGQPVNVLGGTKYEFNPRVIYQGTKDLSYEWSVVSNGGSVFLEDADVKLATVTFDRLGTYKLRLRVYENGGTISAKDTASYSVTEIAPLGLTLSTNPGAVRYSEGASGAAVLSAEISGGVASQGFGVQWSVASATSPTGILATLSGASSGLIGSRRTSNAVTFSRGSATDTDDFLVTCTVTNAGVSVTTSATIVVTVGAVSSATSAFAG